MKTRKQLIDFEHKGNEKHHFKLRPALLSLCMLTFIGGYSQTGQVNLNLKNATVKELFREIEKQTSYRFSYRDIEINNKGGITISGQGKELKEVLTNELAKQELSYTVSGNKIIVSTAKKEAVSTKEKKITGKVLDENGDPIIGASIKEKNTTNGTITDLDGNFALNVSNNASLEISYIGFETQTLRAIPGKLLTITMHEDSEILDEVVVIGYGTQKKKEVTGAVSSVSADKLTKISSVDFGTAIQGLAAGVNVQASSGAPGEMANIQIRGIGSITGENSPLYVIDGMPYDGVPNINSNEIASIDILKDAASASVYGTRASNGVVLITTKTGKEGKPRLELNASYGLQCLQNAELPLSNTSDMLYYLWMRAKENNTESAALYLPIVYNLQGFDTDINWLKKITNNFSPTQDYSLNISGGKNDITYNLNVGYFNQNGIFLNSGYERGNIRYNSMFKRGKLKINLGLSGNISKQNVFPSTLILDAIKLKPYQYFPIENRIYDIYTSEEQDTQISNIGSLAQNLLRNNNKGLNTFSANMQAEYEIINGLKLLWKIGGNIGSTITENFTPKISIYMADGSLSSKSDEYRSSILNRNENSSKFFSEISLNYKRSFNNHNLDLLMNYSFEKSSYKQFSAQKYDLISNNITVLDAATNDALANGYKTKNVLLGLLGRVQYNYKSKYLMSLSIRSDASSKFNEKNYWGIFPSVMLGWNMSDEKFWENIKNIISTSRIRASYGTTGNNRLKDYVYQRIMDIGYDYVFNTGQNENLGIGVIQKEFANKDIKWETTTSYDVGLDLAFLNNKVTFGADIYLTNKKNMLFNVTIPPSASGVSDSKLVMNVGDMQNKGIELAFGYKTVKKEHSFSFDWTFTKNINTVTKVSDSSDMVYLGEQIMPNNFDKIVAVKKGYQAGAFFLIPTEGIIRTEEELAEYKLTDPTAHLGSLKYVDVNGNGSIGDEDRVYYGSGAPKFETNLNFNYGYKNLDFSMQIYSAVGGNVYNGTKAYAYQNERHADLTNSFSHNNKNSNIPLGISPSDNSYRIWSDYFLEDGSFIRVKNIMMGYTLPQKTIKKLGLSKLRIFLAAQNPLTFTKYSGFDPEIGGDGLALKGIDAGNYPVSSSYRIGCQLNF